MQYCKTEQEIEEYLSLHGDFRLVTQKNIPALTSADDEEQTPLRLERLLVDDVAVLPY